jgi:hypothetical protein
MIRSAVRTGRSEAMRSSTVNSSQIQTKKVALLRNQLLHFRRDKSLSREAFSIGNLYAKEAR